MTDSLGNTADATARVDMTVDGDGIQAKDDNCPFDYNPDQTDSNNNGTGDTCDLTSTGYPSVPTIVSEKPSRVRVDTALSTPAPSLTLQDLVVW